MASSYDIKQLVKYFEILSEIEKELKVNGK